MKGKMWTTCGKCNRVLWVEDANKDGLCCDCEKIVAVKPAKPPQRAGVLPVTRRDKKFGTGQ